MRHQEPEIRWVWNQVCDLSWKTVGFGWMQVPAHGLKSQSEMKGFRMCITPFTWLWLTPEFSPAPSQRPSLGIHLRNSPKTWDMTILSRAIFPQPLYKGYAINKFAFYLSLCLLLKSFCTDIKSLSFIMSWDELCSLSWKIVFESHLRGRFTEAASQAQNRGRDHLWPQSQVAQRWRICLPMPKTQEVWVRSLGWVDPWRRKWLPLPVFLLGKFHGQRTLGYRRWSGKELDMTEYTCTHTREWIYLDSYTLYQCKVSTLPTLWGYICGWKFLLTNGEGQFIVSDTISTVSSCRKSRVSTPGEDSRASLVAQIVKILPAVWETWVRSLGREDPLENEMATHCSILAWKISWIEGLGRATVHGVAKSRTRLSDFSSQRTLLKAHSPGPGNETGGKGAEHSL